MDDVTTDRNKQNKKKCCADWFNTSDDSGNN